jgi:hypothetical protein
MMAMKNGIVKLNIGGYKYETTKETLCSKGENYFSALLRGRIPTTTDEDGYIFVGKYATPWDKNSITTTFEISNVPKNTFRKFRRSHQENHITTF